MNDRSAFVTVDGVEYELIFTTAAAKKIDEHCGGLEHAWDIIANAEKYTDKVNEILWFFVSWYDTGVTIGQNANLTALGGTNIIADSMTRSKSDIHSEDDSKNTVTG